MDFISNSKENKEQTAQSYHEKHPAKTNKNTLYNDNRVKSQPDKKLNIINSKQKDSINSNNSLNTNHINQKNNASIVEKKITLLAPDSSIETVVMGNRHPSYVKANDTDQVNKDIKLQDIQDEVEEDSNAEVQEYFKDDAFTRYFRKKLWFQLVIRTSCILSVISVCSNTPQTFVKHPNLQYITFVIDAVTGLIFLAEAILKMHSKGLFVSKHSYLRSPGRIFELFMLICILASVVLQVLEITKVIKVSANSTSPETQIDYIIVSFIRAPRSLLLLRVMKSMLNIHLPKSVSLRSIKQIWGVLLFSAYFMSLAAVIGVQLFGVMKYYCVKTNSRGPLKYSDFLIPATRCSPHYEHSYKCPQGFQCKGLEFKKFRQDRRYFENVFDGLLTVYEAASLEGWSGMMYDAMDTHHFAFAVVYYIAVIFFVAWLVKNVFIAIITGAFADLRVQVTQLNQSHADHSKKSHNEHKMLQKIDLHMELVHIEHLLPTNYVSRFLFKIMNWTPTKCLIYICIFADAVIQAMNVEDKNLSINIQVVFTMVFNLEGILKIIAMGIQRYYKYCLFEGILCLGSTVFLPFLVLQKNGFAVFIVMRVFRLVLISSALTSFLKRILGSGKKLGSLLLFWLAALVMSSGITMQLFCGIGIKSTTLQPDDLFDFGDFPSATKAMFQVFMTENWNGVMDDLLWAGQDNYSFLVFIVFIIFHLLAATILISVFVALILDNLELNEEVKVMKQSRIAVDVTETKEKLSKRIRIFEKLKPRPKVVNLDHVNECSLPKVRQSFINKFISGVEKDEEEKLKLITPAPLNRQIVKQRANTDTNVHLSYVENKPKVPNYLTSIRKQSSVSAFMADVNHKRSSVSDTNFSRKSTKVSRRTISRNKKDSPTKDGPSMKPVLGIRLSNQKKRLTGEEKRKVISEKKGKDIDLGFVRQKMEEAQRKKESQIESLRENHPTFDKSLFIFSPKHPLRKLVYAIVHAGYKAFNVEDKSIQLGAFSLDRLKRYFGSQTYLDWVMLVCTQVSCIAMLFEDRNRRVFKNPSLQVIEYVFVISTTIELILKIIADGLLFTPKAFIQDFGGVLHVFIYIFSLIYLIMEPVVIKPFSAAYYILCLRALRPLRIITLAPPLRKVVMVLLSGYKDIIKVAVLQLFMMFMFASYGVQTFSQKLQRCNDLNITNETACTGRFLRAMAKPRNLEGLAGSPVKVLVPRRWENPRNFNFDTLGAAFLALLEILSLEGWTDIRDIIEDRVGWVGSLYPHLYVMMACLLGLTLFIGVIVTNFNEIKGTALLTVEQKRWNDLKKKLELAQPLHIPVRPNKAIKAKLYDLFNGKPYKIMYALVVIINMVSLCLPQWQPNEHNKDDKYIVALVLISVVCCFLFLFDLMLKVFAYTFRGYWLSWRNRFDFALTILGLVFSVWTLSTCGAVNLTDKNQTCPESRQFGVAVFILRFLSLSGKHNHLRMLMLTVVMSLMKSFFTIGVMLMIMACYAFVGVILFGSVKHGVTLNRQANFETSWNALLLLFRVTTGEDWNKIMHDAAIAPPYCRFKPTEDYAKGNCGSLTAALWFFHSFYLIISYIFLNLFIAVVIANFSIFYSTDDDPIMSQQDIKCFQEVWNDKDTDNSGSISVEKAKEVIYKLRRLLKLDDYRDEHGNKYPLLLKCMCAEVEKLRAGKPVSFHDLLFVLAYKKVHMKNLQLEERMSRVELEENIREEVASEVIREWIVTLCQRKKKNSFLPQTSERKLSGASGDSRLTEASRENSEELNDVTSFPAYTGPIFQRQLSFDGLRKRKGNDDAEKEEIYSWWGDEVEQEL